MIHDLKAKIAEAAPTFCSKFHQKCIYLSVAGRVEFVEGEGDA